MRIHCRRENFNFLAKNMRQKKSPKKIFKYIFVFRFRFFVSTFSQIFSFFSFISGTLFLSRSLAHFVMQLFTRGANSHLINQIFLKKKKKQTSKYKLKYSTYILPSTTNVSHFQQMKKAFECNYALKT